MKIFTHGCIAIGCAAAAFAVEPLELDWDGMKGKFEFEDPFTELTQEQIYNLAMVARVRALDEKGRSVSEGMREEVAAAVTVLEEQEVDIEGLLAKRNEIAELRKKRAEAPVMELDGKSVKLSGFVLPLEYEEKKVSEFLLVPWVGACIHTPPPPSNQIAHVIPVKPFTSKGFFEAVTVSGTITIGERNEELFLVDGKATIPMSYAFGSAEVEKFVKK